MEKTYSFDIEIGCLYWKDFEFNLKKATMHGHVDGFIITTGGFLQRKYHIKGASQNFVDYVKKLVKLIND